jgi:hypothetical protein
MGVWRLRLGVELAGFTAGIAWDQKAAFPELRTVCGGNSFRACQSSCMITLSFLEGFDRERFALFREEEDFVGHTAFTASHVTKPRRGRKKL